MKCVTLELERAKGRARGVLSTCEEKLAGGRLRVARVGVTINMTGYPSDISRSVHLFFFLRGSIKIGIGGRVKIYIMRSAA